MSYNYSYELIHSNIIRESHEQIHHQRTHITNKLPSFTLKPVFQGVILLLQHGKPVSLLSKCFTTIPVLQPSELNGLHFTQVRWI